MRVIDFFGFKKKQTNFLIKGWGGQGEDRMRLATTLMGMQNFYLRYRMFTTEFVASITI